MGSFFLILFIASSNFLILTDIKTSSLYLIDSNLKKFVKKKLNSKQSRALPVTHGAISH